MIDVCLAMFCCILRLNLIQIYVNWIKAPNKPMHQIRWSGINILIEFGMKSMLCISHVSDFTSIINVSFTKLQFQKKKIPTFQLTKWFNPFSTKMRMYFWNVQTIEMFHIQSQSLFFTSECVHVHKNTHIRSTNPKRIYF